MTYPASNYHDNEDEDFQLEKVPLGYKKAMLSSNHFKKAQLKTRVHLSWASERAFNLAVIANLAGMFVVKAHRFSTFLCIIDLDRNQFSSVGTKIADVDHDIPIWLAW